MALFFVFIFCFDALSCRIRKLTIPIVLQIILVISNKNRIFAVRLNQRGKVKTEYLVIEFVKLKDGKHELDFQVDRSFFEFFGNEEVEAADIKVQVEIEKSSNWMNLLLNIAGNIHLSCDRCLESVGFPIQTKYRILVKLDSVENTPTANEDQETELIYLKSNDYKLSVAQQVYETSLLALPMLRNCDVLESKPCNKEMLAKLNELRDSPPDSEDSVDPRWLKLKEILKK